MPSLIPKSSYETRPRVAVEIRPEGVFAARANDGSGQLAQVASAHLPSGFVQPSLRQQNITNPQRVSHAVRQVLVQLQQGKLRDVSLVVPDAAVRVVLLDFDTLPSDPDEAIAVVRFRLTRLLPFPPDAAQISYQIMGERARQLQVLAVAIPYAVLSEYEAVVRDAGFEPGAVLPSSLAVASAVDDSAQTAALVMNCGGDTMTTAILRRGELLLYRTLETAPATVRQPANLPPASAIAVVPTVPTDHLHAAAATREYGADDLLGSETGDGPLVESFLPARELAEAEAQGAAMELRRAIAVAAAYYEDSLAAPPTALLTAGSITAEQIDALLDGSDLPARELLQQQDLSSVTHTSVPLGLLAGLRGALRNETKPAARPGSRMGARA